MLVAEIVHHFGPKVVALHNYPPANASKQKQDNWHTLNSTHPRDSLPHMRECCAEKVFRKLEMVVPDNVIDGIIACKPGIIEVVLNNLRLQIEKVCASFTRGLTPKYIVIRVPWRPSTTASPYQRSSATHPRRESPHSLKIRSRCRYASDGRFTPADDTRSKGTPPHRPSPPHLRHTKGRTQTRAHRVSTRCRISTRSQCQPSNSSMCRRPKCSSKRTTSSNHSSRSQRHQ